MRQALHIFAKDVRRLRLELAAMLLLDLAFIWLAGSDNGLARPRLVQGVSRLLMVFLPAAWVFVIMLLVHEEPLVGDRQYWLSRPFAWKSLLGAKMLFLVAFFAVPLMISDSLILRLQGLPFADPAALLWRLSGLMFGFVLPVSAVAAVSKNLRRFALIALVLGCAAGLVMTTARFGVWGSAVWVLILTMLASLGVGASAVLLRQYRRAGVGFSAAVIIASLLGTLFLGRLIPFDRAFAATSWVRPPQGDFSGVKVSRIPERFPPFTGFFGRTVTEEALLPVRFSGLPEGVTFEVERIDVSVTTATGVHPRFTAELDRPRGEEWLVLSWKRVELPPESKPVVRVHARFYLSCYRDVGSVRPAAFEWYSLPGGVGRCFNWRNDDTGWAGGCRFSYRMPGMLRVVGPDGATQGRYGGELLDTAVLPARLSMSPVDAQWLSDTSDVRLVLGRPVAHLIRDMEIPELALWDYSRDNPALELERVR